MLYRFKIETTSSRPSSSSPKLRPARMAKMSSGPHRRAYRIHKHFSIIISFSTTHHSANLFSATATMESFDRSRSLLSLLDYTKPSKTPDSNHCKEYLLRGILFDVVKTIGRWKSDAFILYLRKHAQILAPYMQAVPAIHEQFIRYTMPQIR